MITYLGLGLAILVLAYLSARAIQSANPATLARLLKITLITLGGLVGGYLLLTGRLAHALPLLLVAMVLVGRLGRLRRGLAGAFGGGAASAGQSSQVSTGYLRMTLDHHSGSMAGEVLRGAFTGRSLSDLGIDELLDLYRECLLDDAEGARVLETYLDRGAHAGTWRERLRVRSASGGAARTEGAMSPEEARRILGVGPDATAEEVKDAHRRLMMANHPDHGGSDYLAAKINQAKDVLLGA